jgi:hypothetical protein
MLAQGAASNASKPWVRGAKMNRAPEGRQKPMRLITDDLPEVDEVTVAQIGQVLGDDAFGKFAVLMSSDEAFIQAACVWEPGTESRRFIEETGSDPFRLEYREETTGGLFAADGNRTLAEVTQAFIEYLNGQTAWLSRFTWHEVDSR